MRRRQRGMTLIEVLISLALIMVGMLGLMATLSTATVGSSMSQRLSQAQARAQMIIEAIRGAPKPTLDCLATTAASSWSNCESGTTASCLQNQVNDMGTQNIASCIFTIGTMTNIPGPSAGTPAVLNETVDRNGQPYQLYYSSTSLQSTSVVKNANNVYDVQVTIAWSDDGTAGGASPKHFVTLHTGIFQP
jgi:prepilin-type N-terminal cleavage/methylation domain-containing protein